MILSPHRIISAALTIIAAALLTTPASGADVERDSGFLRVKESADGSRIALQIAARRYQRTDGAGPIVTLVAVAHLGEPSFYRQIQQQLDEHDVVLYESVTPPGTGRAPHDASDTERAAHTTASMAFLAGVIHDYYREHDQYPRSIDELHTHAAAMDSRLGQWVRSAFRDAWGHAVRYECTLTQSLRADDTVDLTETFDLVSDGADGAPGGVGANADIRLTDTIDADDERFAAGAGEDNLQQELATTLGLAFQLNAIDYDHPGWRCSDMSIDQLERSLREKGSDMTFVSSLTGSSMSGRLINIMLRGIRVFDAFAGGAVSDMFKVVLIEMLGNEQLVEQSMSQMDEQMGAGFSEVIVEERNQVVMDDLTRLIRDEPDVQTVGVFYGAAHMADLVQRMRDQLELIATDAEPTWLTAIEVDLDKSAVSRRELAQVRLMMRRMLGQ